MKKIIICASLLLIIASTACSNSSVITNTAEPQHQTNSTTLDDILADEKYHDETTSEQDFLDDLKSFQEDLDEAGDSLIEENDTGNYSASDEAIWQYCMDRWDYYDELEGSYSGDKYTKQVFEDAAKKFGITASKAESIWNEVDKEKLGLN